MPERPLRYPARSPTPASRRSGCTTNDDRRVQSGANKIGGRLVPLLQRNQRDAAMGIKPGCRARCRCNSVYAEGSSGALLWRKSRLCPPCRRARFVPDGSRGASLDSSCRKSVARRAQKPRRSGFLTKPPLTHRQNEPVFDFRRCRRIEWSVAWTEPASPTLDSAPLQACSRLKSSGTSFTASSASSTARIGSRYLKSGQVPRSQASELMTFGSLGSSRLRSPKSLKRLGQSAFRIE